MYVDHVIKRCVPRRLLPYIAAKHVAGNDAVAMAHEIFQQLEFPRGQLERSSATAGDVLNTIELQIVDPKRDLAFGSVPAAEGPNARLQFGHSEWFGQIVVGPGVEAMDPVFDSIFRGDQQDGRAVAQAPKIAHDFYAISSGKHDVENQQIELLRLREKESVFACRCHSDDVLFRFETLTNGERQLRLILDRKYPHNSTVELFFLTSSSEKSQEMLMLRGSAKGQEVFSCTQPPGCSV